MWFIDLFSFKKIRSKKMCIWIKFHGGDARALKYEGSIGSAALTFIRQQQKRQTDKTDMKNVRPWSNINGIRWAITQDRLKMA